MILSLLLCAFASPQDAPVQELRPGVAALKEAEKIFALGNPEQARVLVERAITEMFAARPDALDVEDDRALRDAGALAYKLRSMEPARRAWDAVRRFREKTLDPTSMELQNARGNVSWIGEQMGLVAEARVLEEQILAVLEKSLPPDHDALQTARGNLGDTLLQQGEFDRALELFTQVATVRRAKLAVSHPQRLRSELDLGCALVATGESSAAETLFMDVLRDAPADSTAIRVRAAADLVLSVAARSDSAVGADRFALDGVIRLLGNETRAAGQQIGKLEWRAAEIRVAELGPFVDLLASAHAGLGVVPPAEVRRSSMELGFDAPTPNGSVAVFRRWERSRIEGTGRDRRVVADERLGVALYGKVEQTWLDLGPLSAARALVQAWDDAARTGDAREQASAVARSLFAPVSKALGDPRVLSIVPDDVIWAVPLHALDLRSESGQAVTVEVALRAPSRPEPGAQDQPWTVFGDPSPTVAEDELGLGPSDANVGAAAVFLTSVPPATTESTSAWDRRLGTESRRGEKTAGSYFNARTANSKGVVLTTPLWSAPDDVPCATAARPIVATTPLAAAMAREDVFGGSSAADLCGLLLSGYAMSPGEDARVRQVPRAADLRSVLFANPRRLVIAAPPPRADVVVRARDIQALARALVDAGFVDVCFATQTIRDVERVSFPRELEETIPRATQPTVFTIGGPWLRVRAVP